MAERGNTVEATFIDWQPWNGTDNITNVTFFDNIEFQLLTATGGPWTPVRSSDGNTWDPCVIYDQMSTSYTNITTSNVGKMFTASGRGHFMLQPTNPTDVVSGNVRAS